MEDVGEEAGSARGGAKGRVEFVEIPDVRDLALVVKDVCFPAGKRRAAGVNYEWIWAVGCVVWDGQIPGICARGIAEAI